jgi:hypothetical protein
MTSPKPEIPILRQIEALARQYAQINPELAKAFEELDQCRADQVAMRAEILEHRGVECVVCNKRFVPLPDGSNCFCSIGCRYAEAADALYAK